MSGWLTSETLTVFVAFLALGLIAYAFGVAYARAAKRRSER